MRAPASALELAVFEHVQVWLALAMTALGFGGVFASFTYIAPMMTEVAGFSAGAVTWLLVLFGVGLVVGNLLGGKAADRSLMPSLYLLLTLLAAILVVFVFTAHARCRRPSPSRSVGAVGFATVPPLQKRVMDKAAGAPALASARQHRRLQPRQRDRRLPRRPDHLARSRLHRRQLGRRRARDRRC